MGARPNGFDRREFLASAAAGATLAFSPPEAASPGEERSSAGPSVVYLLHHSLIADAHRPEFGPVGFPGNLSFIEADGSLRPGHGAFNEF